MKWMNLFFLLMSTICISQNLKNVAYKNAPLKKVIADIESKTQVLFSYKQSIIENKKISFQAKSISLTDFLMAIAQQHKISFKRVTDQQIIITSALQRINICGYVFDAVRKIPLPDTNIFVKGKSKSTISDKDGYFTMNNVMATDTIVLQYYGYKMEMFQSKRLINSNCQNIFLSEEAELLGDIVLNAYITKGFDKSNDGSTRIKRSELGVLAGQTDPDVFQSLTSISGITSLNESVSDIQIRGGNKDQNLVLYDDIKLYNTGHFFGMLTAINPYMVDEAKVYKGGASAAYGDRISGVLDISSGTKLPDSTTIGMGVNGTHLDGYLKSRIGNKAAIYLSVRRSYVDWIRTPTFNALSSKIFENSSFFINRNGAIEQQNNETLDSDANNKFDFFDTNLKVILKPSTRDYIGISALQTNSNINFSTTLEEDLIADIILTENRGISAVWEHQRKKASYSTKVYFSSFRNDYDNSFSTEGFVEERNNQSNTVEDIGASFDAKFNLSPQHQIKFGYQFNKNDVFFNLLRDFESEDEEENEDEEEEDKNEEDKNENSKNDDDELDFNSTRTSQNSTHAFFGEYIFKPVRNSFISLGLRASNYSLFDGFYYEPRLNIEYPITNALRWKATAEQRYQVISELVQFEDTQLRLQNQVWTLSGVNNIPLLSSFQYSSGIVLNFGTFIFDVDVYSKRIEGLTSFTNGFTNAIQDFSEGESDIFGIDIFMKKSFHKFDFTASYTYNNVKYIFDELQETPFRGNNDITNNFNISISYPINEWQLALAWQYRSGSPFTPIESFDVANDDIIFGDINSDRLPDYHRLDASLFRAFYFDTQKCVKGVFSLSFQNIYARQVPLSVSYRIDTNPATEDDELNIIQPLSLGFMPNASLRIFF